MTAKRTRTDASRRADKKYNEKSLTLTATYRPTDIADGQRIKSYLAQTGQSANSYIKQLIKSDLDSKNVPYPYIDNTDTADNN